MLPASRSSASVRSTSNRGSRDSIARKNRSFVARRNRSLRNVGWYSCGSRLNANMHRNAVIALTRIVSSNVIGIAAGSPNSGLPEMTNG